MALTIVGLGPGNPADLTVAARAAIQGAGVVLLRTERHPTVDALAAEGLRYESYDAWYDAASSFDALYERIVEDVLKRARDADVVYAVPGHPLVAESTVQRLLAQIEVPVRVLAGLSGVEATYTLLGVDPIGGLQILDALQLEGKAIDPTTGALVLQVYNRKVASRAKLELMRFFPDDHPVTMVRAAGIPGQQTRETMPLYAIDRGFEVDHLTSLYLPPAPPVGLARLREVMARLRAPDGGCPWDREQTHESLVPFLIEESYEAAEALRGDDDEHRVEELGDVLFQLVFHAQIAEEEERFDFDEIAQAQAEKLVARHPHVFADARLGSSEEVLANWDALKASQREQQGLPEETPPSRVLGKFPPLDPVGAAQKLLKKAIKAGFTYPGAEGALAKLDEEIAELKAAATPAEREHELGDVFFALVAAARYLGLDPEAVFKAALRRFYDRFAALEGRLAAEGVALGELPGPAILERWAAAKAGA